MRAFTCKVHTHVRVSHIFKNGKSIRFVLSSRREKKTEGKRCLSRGEAYIKFHVAIFQNQSKQKFLEYHAKFLHHCTDFEIILIFS